MRERQRERENNREREWVEKKKTRIENFITEKNLLVRIKFEIKERIKINLLDSGMARR